MKEMVCLNKRYKKTDVAIKNGQPREISNIVHTRHDTKANQKKTTQNVLDTTLRKQTQIT